MGDKDRISGRVVAAARVLAGISQADFAAIAGLTVKALQILEGGGSAWIESERDAAFLKQAMKHFGVIVIGESDGLGAGVRLKFTRQDVKQIARLEGEGGIVGSDDAP